MPSRSARLVGNPSPAAAIRFGLVVLAAVWSAVSAYAQTDSPQKGEKKTALVVIDIQEFYFPGGAMPLDRPEAAAANCKRLLEKFRADKRLVVHVGHNASKGAAFNRSVTPLDGEKVVMKDEVSAFNGTDLLEYLRQNEVERLVICGMQTHMCVEGAVRAAYDLGFECILVRDACATRALTYGEKKIAAEDVHLSTLATLDRNYAKVVDTESLVKNE